MSELRSIVYVSTAVRVMAEPELEALLVEARDLNLETNTTGVLLYSEGTFMQCFEGSEEAVRVTYDRIRASTRHKGIIELLNAPVAQRSFTDWQMGFGRASHSVLLALSSAQWESQAENATGPAAASPGMQLLQHFWSQARR
jgi:hypothetical protein